MPDSPGSSPITQVLARSVASTRNDVSEGARFTIAPIRCEENASDQPLGREAGVQVDVVDLHLAQPHAGDGGVPDHPATRRTFEGLGPELVGQPLDGVRSPASCRPGTGRAARPGRRPPAPRCRRSAPRRSGTCWSARPRSGSCRTPAIPSALRARCATTCARVQSGSPLGAARAASSRPSTVRTSRWVASGSSSKAPWGSRSTFCWAHGAILTRPSTAACRSPLWGNDRGTVGAA